MKIAFIVGRFPVLSQTFVLRQITGLLDRGHDVDIFAYDRGREPVSHQYVRQYGLLERTYYLNGAGPAPAKAAQLVRRARLVTASFHKAPRAFARALNVARFGKSAISLGVAHAIAPFADKGPYDVVHCQFGPIGHLGVLLKQTGLLRGKLVTSFLGYDVSSYPMHHGPRVYENLFAQGDIFLCVSEHMKKRLVELGCDPQKVIVHRLGAELDRSAPALRRWAADGKLAIATVARLVEKKGVEYGIRAVAKVLSRYPRVEYRIAGDGPLRDRLCRLIEELGIAGNVKLLGWKEQAEIASLLQTSDILLAPSVTPESGDEEGTPVVIMEAFAQGLAVVSTYHAGIPEVVIDGRSGFLVPERDVEALAEKIEILINDPALRLAMGRAGRELMAREYDIEKLNDRLVAIYLAKSPSAASASAA
ncbi:MAG TPA: glycosyltransferase [Candidatus Acidoferrales bacterium]|nr:glycosyltransferase [Candidatus Acidoferrales bacterium]